MVGKETNYMYVPRLIDPRVLSLYAHLDTVLKLGKVSSSINDQRR